MQILCYYIRLRNPIDKVQFRHRVSAPAASIWSPRHAGRRVQFYVWEVQSAHCLARPRDDDKDSQDRGSIRTALACPRERGVICTRAACDVAVKARDPRLGGARRF